MGIQLWELAVIVIFCVLALFVFILGIFMCTNNEEIWTCCHSTLLCKCCCDCTYKAANLQNIDDDDYQAPIISLN